MHKVTVYSNWVKTSEHEFETQEEAREFAEEMKNQQYATIIDEEEVDEVFTDDESTAIENGLMIPV